MQDLQYKLCSYTPTSKGLCQPQIQVHFPGSTFSASHSQFHCCLAVPGGHLSPVLVPSSPLPPCQVSVAAVTCFVSAPLWSHDSTVPPFQPCPNVFLVMIVPSLKTHASSLYRCLFCVRLWPPCSRTQRGKLSCLSGSLSWRFSALFCLIGIYCIILFSL